MIRIASTALLAGLLAAAAHGVADAEAMVTTTPFTGQTTDFTSATSSQNPYKLLPYKDSYGNTVSTNSSGDVILYGYGLNIAPENGGQTLPYTSNLTFALAAGTNEIGFYFNSPNDSEGDYLASATFSNGDSFTGGPTYDLFNSNNAFLGFSDISSFTEMTLTFMFANAEDSDDMTSFVTATAASVPEPASLVLVGFGGLAGLGYARRRRRAGAVAETFSY